MAEIAVGHGQKTLIVDTCALLDIVRAPIRVQFSSEHLRNARAIGAALEVAAPPVRVIVCNWVVGEYERGIHGVEDEVRQLMKLMWANHNQAHEMMAVHRGDRYAQFDSGSWINELVGLGKDVVDHFLRAIPQFTATPEDEQRATARTRDARAPSHKGKGSLADAVVTEFALRIARETGCDGDGRPLTMLLSSNTKDFCDGKFLKPDLRQEFESANLDFASTWSAARYTCLAGSEIGIPRRGVKFDSDERI